ncbi:MAG TPA: hypothetical protein PK103_01120 [Elusimicrobiales bacterium]|nr:hypothetical protein [Elusimicrobiales bacterium]HOL61945.1 hypothetical protein [Elusimicrobiales bacterium]HPO95162.1 hypothetical protein [Elusimicrobiales bacterium]
MKLMISVVLFSFLNAYSLEFINKKEFENIKSNISMPETNVSPKTLSNNYGIAEISKPHLIANASKKILFGYVKDDNQYKEFVEMYTKILKDNGFKISEIKREGEMAIITYLAHNEMGIRRFIGDQLNYNAKDDKEIIKLMDEVVSKLEENNMKVVAKYIVKTDFLRPTFMIYYLTEVKDFQEKEMRLRQLKKGEDIDFELLENSVKIIKKDSSFSMLYIGKELGFVSKLAVDENSAIKKLEDYKQFLKENKKEFINYNIKKLDKPFTSGEATFNFLLNIYFFQ